MTIRKVHHVLQGHATSDGDGVKLTRVFSPDATRMLDPFLLLDEFNSDEAADYIGGFPAHPHRGFETVTYMLEGNMLHRDHLGHSGRLGSGGVQWMTAGRGIIHSEMPQQEEGRMRGFQLWINLPAAEKMKSAAYRDISADEIPSVPVEGGEVRVVAGHFSHDGKSTAGPVTGITTNPLYLDVILQDGGGVSIPVPETHTAVAYAYAGRATVGGTDLAAGQLAVLGDGDEISIEAQAPGTRLLVLAGHPLKEPVAHYGPFVMNNREQLEQALQDYRDGVLTGD